MNKIANKVLNKIANKIANENKNITKIKIEKQMNGCEYNMFLAIDTETTGINADCQVLTAYFLVLDTDLNEIAHLDLKIRYPYYKVYTKALEVNKIDLVAHDREAIDVSQAKIVLEKFLNDHKPQFRYIPLGHNIQFDLRMLKNSGLLSEDAFSPNVLDTIVIAQFLKTCKMIPSKQSLSLSNLIKYFGIKMPGTGLGVVQFHTAEYDIRMTVQLLKHFTGIINRIDVTRSDTKRSDTSADQETAECLERKRKRV
jgi:DNA polymerase III epsilon subunit-like protein